MHAAWKESCKRLSGGTGLDTERARLGHSFQEKLEPKFGPGVREERLSSMMSHHGKLHSEESVKVEHNSARVAEYQHQKTLKDGQSYISQVSQGKRG